jgi:tetratricopeptide (TPR) repeat protein
MPKSRSRLGDPNQAPENIRRAEALLARVLSVEPNNATAHWINGALLLAKKQFSAAIAEQNAAIAIDTNFAWAHADLGFDQTWSGRAAEASPQLETALRLSPRDPARNIWELLILRRARAFGAVGSDDRVVPKVDRHRSF